VQGYFYEQTGPAEFAATAATAGPWSADAQHGGPPSALAARLIEAAAPAPGLRLARVSVDILRPVPVARLTAHTRMVRPGRRVALAETILRAGDQDVLHARGWLIADTATGAEASPAGPPPPPVPAQRTVSPIRFPDAVTDGYVAAMDWRYVAGGPAEQPGPAAAWVRPLASLLPGEPCSPMSAALLVADSASGISAVLDPARYLFLNVDLTVVLHRDPAGGWLLLDAATTIGQAGTGMVVSTLSDTAGPCGRGMQTLMVAQR
jgi:hypothetical protein